MQGTSIIINVLFRFLSSFFWIFSRTYRNSRKLKGTWSYECILKTGIFIDKHPDGIERNAHGGSCTIDFENSLMATRVIIKGSRTWAANIDERGNRNDFYKLPDDKLWESNEAAFITDSRIMYKYSIDNSLAGITFMDIICESNSKRIMPRGGFFYLPDNNTYALKLNEIVNTFPRMLATKGEPISQLALRATGKVRLYKE